MERKSGKTISIGPLSKQRPNVLVLCFVALCLLFVYKLPTAQAQLEQLTQKTEIVQLMHTKPKLLPAAGKPLTLYLTLRGTNNTSRKLRVLVYKDNKYSDLTVKNAYLNEYDHPTYEIKQYAPLVEISYQFILLGDDGKTISSKQYSLNRKCMPEVDLVSLEMDPDTSPNERPKLLIKQAKKLDEELALYGVAIDLIEELKELVEKK